MNQAFKALAFPTCRQILSLQQTKDCSAGEIAAVFSITQPRISNHLNILKQAVLVYTERRGQHQIHTLNLTVFQELMG